MLRNVFFLLLSISLASSGVYAQSAPAPDPGLARNAVYVEFGGAAGDRLSINYERVIWRESRVTFLGRAGLFYWQQAEAEPWNVRRDAGDMIFGIQTVYAAKSNHRIETGVGVNIRWQSLEGISPYLSHSLWSANLGYRRLPKKGKGLMWRANLMLIHNASYNWLQYAIEGDKIPARIMPWAGVSVGYAF